MALNIIQEIVERSIFTKIEDLLIKEGYLPDLSAYDFTNADLLTSTAAQEAYNNELINIRNEKGFAIEIFNFSSNQEKGFKAVPRIVLDPEAFYPGQIGLDVSPQYESKGGMFDKLKFPSQLSDYYINIYCVANTSEQFRILNAAVVQALPRKGYIKRYTDGVLLPSGNLFVEYVSYNQHNNTDMGIIEKSYRYAIPDLQEAFADIDALPISKIKEIEETIIAK